ncbi:MAG TPA: sigma-70 family RNA polymerase sigma factor [Acidobacteriota bacterium]|jgi:RNA polymerase sigma-70 factor (ECF subfamily)
MRSLFKNSKSRGSDSGDIYEELLLAHLEALYAFALRLTRNQHAAEDLVQEAALKALKAFGKLREKERFKSWIFQILRNIFLDQHSSRSAESLEDLQESDLIDGESLLVERLLNEEISDALDHLPGDYRVVLCLSDVEGFAQKEISEILGCPIGTVGSRLYRGRALLRRKLIRLRRKGSQEGKS